MGRERFGLGLVPSGEKGNELIYKDVLPAILQARKASIFSDHGIIFLRAAVSAYDMVNSSSFGLDNNVITRDLRPLSEDSEDYLKIIEMAEKQAMVESRIGKDWTGDA